MVSQICVDLVKAWEGIEDGDPSTVRLDPYMDPVGIWTIGYGEALTNAEGQFLRGVKAKALAFAKFPNGMSLEEASSRLKVKLDQIEERLQKNGVHGEQRHMDALVSIAYNIGVGSAVGRRSGLLGSTLLRMHRDGNGPILAGELNNRVLRIIADNSKERAPIQTIAQAFAAWSNAGGRWMLGLFRRRVSEYLVYRGDSLESALATARRFHG